MSAPEQYRGSITREQWLVNETRTVARLRVYDGLTDTTDIIDRVMAENLFGYPTEREVKSISRACNRRLEALYEPTPAGADADSNDAAATHQRLLRLIAGGTSEQLCQTNLYAMARDNRVVWDFLAAVVGPKLSSCDYRLAKREIVSFIDGLGTQDAKAATWSDATKNKIRQVLSACLEACSIYDRKSEALTAPLLDFELEQLMRQNGDQALLAAFGTDEDGGLW